MILTIVGLALICLAEVKAAEEAQEAPYEMPPFEMNEVPEGLPWKYLRIEGYEMITLFPKEMSRRVLLSMQRGQMMLPRAFQPQRSSPIGVILFDATATKSPKAFPAVQAHYGSQRLSHSPVSWRSFSGAIRVYDQDSCIVAMRYENQLPVALLSLRSTAEVALVECRPEPSAWLYQGLFGPFGVYEPGSVGTYSDRDELRFASLLWIDEPTTEALRRDPRLVPELIPLDRFFNAPPPDRKSDAQRFALWQSQARLFVHWALLAKKNPPFEASAFWQFANDSRLGAVSEEKFRSYFDRDYATALAELRAYLPVAVKNGVDRAVPGLHEAATKTEFVYRAATESEVARIKGNFERLETQRLKEADPELAKRYEQAARRSLLRATHFVPADPRVYGILGLLEFDAGEPLEARRHLERAYRDQGLGSRGLLALARLRLDEVKAKDQGAFKLQADDLERVLEPLFAARERKPALVETYRLIAEVWACSEVQPTRGHLAVLQEGVRFFPWDEELRDKTRALHRQFGYEDDPAAVASGER
ncbi:MAG: hypothetical protein HYV95_09735 [Opitutae bacterium]|nr:hypothetical protein [Opitutae bacterium]